MAGCVDQFLGGGAGQQPDGDPDDRPAPSGVGIQRWAHQDLWDNECDSRSGDTESELGPAAVDRQPQDGQHHQR